MKKITAIVAIVAMSLTMSATTPMWLRQVKISPNGKEIAFSYKGDIWKVAATGGTAVRLTSQDSYESYPIWSPDGTKIAFASDRKGNFDIYVMPAQGGSAKRLTTNSAGEVPAGFSADGKYVYFGAVIQDPAESALFPTGALGELYKVGVDGGRTVQVLATPAENICFSRDGKTMLYHDCKGFEDQWRKHHTSSVTRDIWRYDVATGKHTNLTNRGGEDRNPVLAADGKTVYFLSERNGGSFNDSFDINNPAKVQAVTNHTTHPVRFLSMADNGTLCYTYDGEIWVKPSGAEPRKVGVDIVLDEDNMIDNMRVNAGRDDRTYIYFSSRRRSVARRQAVGIYLARRSVCIVGRIRHHQTDYSHCCS